MFGVVPSENDIEALENLTDFHVEYDDKKPDYRKVVAVSVKSFFFSFNRDKGLILFDRIDFQEK